MKKALGFGIALLSAIPASAGVLENRLADAVRDGDPAAVKGLLARHANVNARLPDKSSVLSWAIDRQDAEMVQRLLSAGAKVNVTDGEGTTPLALACELGGPQIVSSLLKSGADAKTVRADGISALALCAATSSPEALSALIAKGADVNAADPQGQTPLMWAAAKGRTDNIAVLVKNGANVNAVTRKGFSPLFFALQSKVQPASFALLDAGADSKALLPDGTTVIAGALLVDNIPFAMQVIARGADVNSRDREGRQLIHVVAANGNPDLVKMVLSKGGDPNAMTGPSLAAAPAEVQVAAAGGGSVAPKEKLKGAKYLVRPPAAATAPLLLAAYAGSVPAMKALIEAGAKPDVKATDGLTLALAAAASGNLEAVKYALTLDPNINAIAQGGKSIMHMVVANRTATDYEAIITYLADKGAILNVPDERGVTPADFVNKVGPENIRVFYVQFMKDRGVAASLNH
ncbi:MAG TPA: ankyrin repeat domain-containing protein [Rhizomicrobium sp.]|nr:ankyrin repeat domain-containing protein [Rhizomicrobium sp.]